MIIDGKDISEFGLILQPRYQHPILPATRDRTIEIPGKHGAYDFGADLNIRQFSLPLVWTKELTQKALQERAREFAAFLTDGNGRPRTLKLAFDYETEKYYMVRYSGSLDIERLLSLGFFELPLIAFDPFAYASANAYDNDPALEYDTGLHYDDGHMYDNPTGFSWAYSRHRSGLFNFSSHSAPLILKIEGTVTNPKIINESTGEELGLPSISGEALEVDSEKMTVKKDGVNALNDMSGDFLELVSGDNGLVFQGSSPNATVTYRWKHKFL